LSIKTYIELLFFIFFPLIPDEYLVGISGKKERKKIVRCFKKWNAHKGWFIFHKGLIEQKDFKLIMEWASFYSFLLSFFYVSISLL